MKLDDINLLPTNLDEAVIALKPLLSKKEHIWFRCQSRDTAIAKAHHGIGTWIRNNWKLWDVGPKAVLRTWFANALDAQHPDDMSTIILDALWSDLNNVPRRTDELLLKFKLHWEDSQPKGWQPTV